jgi:hypothetical protein
MLAKTLLVGISRRFKCQTLRHVQELVTKPGIAHAKHSQSVVLDAG